jgi:16S rRNA (guanine966-N2)-methyltransferase
MSILAPELPGARVLDLFAGSGALGLEALSRGASHATFVELAPASLEALRANIDVLGVGDRVTVRRGDALRFAQGLGAGEYDVAFADPPYSVDAADRLIALFRTTPFDRILSIEHPADRRVEGDDTRRYGDTAVTFCRTP